MKLFHLPRTVLGIFLYVLTAITIQAADVTISTVKLFNDLDGSGLDDDGMDDGVFTVDGHLTITGSGSITCNDPLSPPNGNACPIKIVVGGNLIIQAGGSIYAENRLSGGSGGSIELTIEGSFTVFGGGIISSSRTTTGGSGHGGPITIVVGEEVDLQIGSTIAAANEGGGRAGDIWITADGMINIEGLVTAGPNDDVLPLPGRLTGFVLNSGNTTQKGAKIIVISHMVTEGPGVIIGETGILISQGQDPASDTVSIEACGIEIYGMVASVAKKGNATTTNRPVVVLRSGLYIVISGDNLGNEGVHQGRVRADYVIGEAPEAISVNIFAKNNISISGPSSGAIYTVSSNGGNATNQPGGTINIASLDDEIQLAGLALQADGGPGSGSRGGAINLDAKLDIDVSSSSMVARGATTGGNPDGGDVNLRSYSGNMVSNASSIINVTGGSPSPEGTIALAACGSIGFPPGVIIPASVIPIKTNDCTPAAPSLPEGIASLPECGNEQEEFICHWCTKGSVLSQVWQNMNGDTCAIPDILVDVRLPHTPVDVSKILSGEPATGSIQAAIDYVNANGDPSPQDGEIFIGVIATDCENNPEDFECDANASRGLGGDTPFGLENVVVINMNTERLNIFGCSVTLHSNNESLPVMTIRDGVGKVTVLDIHVKHSGIEGYLIQNNADVVVVKNSRSMYNDIGYRVQDDDVQITGSPSVSHNRIGMLIEGDYNELRTNNEIMDNSEVGIKITGHHNESDGNDVGKSGHPNPDGILVTGHFNELHGDDVTFNTCNGLIIAGSQNEIRDENAEENGCNGMLISGSNNLLEDNKQVKNNAADGIFVSGDNNSLQGNVGSENGGNGIHADQANGANGNTFDDNEADDNVLQGIRACGQIDSGDNDGEDNGLDPQVAFTCPTIAKFEVTDIDEQKIYKYDASFNLVSSSPLTSDNEDANDVAANATNSYVLDKDNYKVYRYVGAVASSKELKEADGDDLDSPGGIAINGDSLWVADGGNQKIYRYSLTAAFAGAGDINAIQEIDFTGNHEKAEGLIAEGTYLYVLDNNVIQFYRYLKTGGAGFASKVMKETGGDGLNTPSGATSDGTSFWIVDNGKDKAYQYNKVALFSAAGSLNATAQYLLYSINKKSTGIAIGTNSVFPLMLTDAGYIVHQDFHQAVGTPMDNNIPEESSIISQELSNMFSKMQVFPNPTNGQVTLKFNSLISSPFALKVADLSGRILIQRKGETLSGENLHILDLNAFSGGIYIINLTCGREIFNSRIAVE